MNVGKQIKEARKKAGLTQAQLAEKCGLATITIRQYESGKREPNMGQIVNLASALNISILHLFDAEDLNEPTYADPDDKLIVEAASSIPPLEPLTNEEAAIKTLLNSFGYDLIKCHGDYGLSHPNGIFTISKSDVDDIITTTVGAVKVAAKSLLIGNYQALNQKTGCHIEPPPEEE